MCIDKSNANFFGIGDWGGDGAGAPGHTWTNPGRCDGESSRPCQDADHWAQKYVARQMKLVAKHAKPDYVVNVGDNFYPGGITSGCQSNNSHPGKDPSGQWARDFEAVYLDDPDLQGKPWLSVLGNHDYGGMGFHMGWDQQIFASWERDDWVMPSQFYFHKVQYRDFAVQYFFLESNFADTDVHDTHHCICQGSGSCWQMADVAGCVSDLHSAWKKSKRMVADNWDATAEWHIVVTHFPPPTVFGDADIMKINSEKEGGIDLLINGHTHMQNCGKDEGTGMTWILTGGGGGITTDAAPTRSGHDDAYGFVDFAINRTHLHFDMHTWGGVDGGSEMILKKVTLESKKHQQKEWMQTTDDSSDIIEV